MADLVDRTLQRLGVQLDGRVSMPGDDRYADAITLWAKPIGRVPRAVAHCRSAEDVQWAVRAARDSQLPLSVRGGGHDWAGRALCDGIVIDMRRMKDVRVDFAGRNARVSGGATAEDVARMADPLALTAVTGSYGGVGIAGFTLGGGYGPLVARFGLALDNLLAADVVLADGRVVTARNDSEQELFWALRGGGGNFGVVTAMHHRLHDVPGVHSGMLIFPFEEAATVLGGCADIMASAPDELTVQLGFVIGLDGRPVVMVIPTWSGHSGAAEAILAPFPRLGTVVVNTVGAMSCGARLTLFNPYIVSGQRVFVETCWLRSLDRGSTDALIRSMGAAVSPGCAIITHEFRGAASRVPAEATAFGLRQDHVLLELFAMLPERTEEPEVRRHRAWLRDARDAVSGAAFPGAYPNLLADDDDRVARSYGPNADRLMKAKRHYDPDDLFSSAIPLPGRAALASRS